MIDTQTLVWAARGDDRLSRAARHALTDGENQLFVSSVTAYEFVDLQARGRFGPVGEFDSLILALQASVLDYPADAWRWVAMLPLLHRDPVDRMLIAHALLANLALVTADETIRRYPVTTIW